MKRGRRSEFRVVPDFVVPAPIAHQLPCRLQDFHFQGRDVSGEMLNGFP